MDVHDLLFKKWIVHQLYGNMNVENCGYVWEIDHCYSRSKTILSNKKEMYKATLWINLRPMFFKVNNIKKAKINRYLYSFQEMKANVFVELNAQEGFNQVFC